MMNLQLRFEFPKDLTHKYSWSFKQAIIKAQSFSFEKRMIEREKCFLSKILSRTIVRVNLKEVVRLSCYDFNDHHILASPQIDFF